MNELDGEVADVEVISKGEDSFPYDEDRYFDQDNFYPMDGDVIRYTAANAAQNTGDYFDQDNFYPADGVMCDSKSNLTDAEFSDAFGDYFKNVVKGARNASGNVASFFSPQETARRRAARYAGRSAKTQESLSRAELNKNVGKETETDKAIAQTLKSSSTPSLASDGKKPMSTTTKVLIGVGIAGIIGVIAFLALRRKKA
jgi:hypothetical protein